MKRLLSENKGAGIKTYWEDLADGGFAIHTEQADVEPILELNKKKQNAGRAYYAQDADMWRVASIPLAVQYVWLTKHNVDALNPDDWPRVKRLLNDPDWRWLKTADVTI